MRQLSTRAGIALFGFTLAFLTIFDAACGNDSSTSNNNGTGQPDGSIGPDFGNGSDGGDGDGQGTSALDTCGGKLCSNYAGPKDFMEPDAPPNASALFGGGNSNANGTNVAQEPGIIYPSHETMFPVNVSHIRHEWSSGSGNDLFRLRFEGSKTTVTIYTNKLAWEPTDEQWDWIAESNRGGSVTLTVSGLKIAAPQQIWQSKSIVQLY